MHASDCSSHRARERDREHDEEAVRGLPLERFAVGKPGDPQPGVCARLLPRELSMVRTVEWVLSHAQEARDTLDAQDAELALAHARIRWLRESRHSTDGSRRYSGSTASNRTCSLGFEPDDSRARRSLEKDSAGKLRR